MNGKILVTGSAGFIGRALMWRLAGPAIPYDVADDRHQDVRTLAVLHAMRRCEAVIHLAGETGARDCNAHPGRAQSTNDTGTFNVLRAANAARIGRVIVASAASVERCASVYGWSLHVAEQWCQMARELWGLEVTVLRLANVYGPGSLHKTSVIAKWMKQLLLRQPMNLKVWGGFQLRDFTYVDDVAEVIERRLHDPLAWDDEPWHYVGTNTLTSTLDLAQLLLATGRKAGATCCNIGVQVEHGPEERQPVLPVHRDARFACTTALEDGLVRTWEYFMAHAAELQAGTAA